MPARMWSSTWQWKSQMPASSGTMSATTADAGSRLTASMRMPFTVTVLPCQCGVCRSTSVPVLITYRGHRLVAEDVAVDRVHQVGLPELVVVEVARVRLLREALQVLPDEGARVL